MHGDRTRIHLITGTSGSYSYSPSSISAATIAVQTMTVTGLRLKDPYILTLPSTGTGDNSLLLIHTYISAADTLKLLFYNVDVGAHTPPTPTASDPYVIKIG